MGVSQLGKGVVIEFDGQLYVIEEYAHVKKAQGRPIAQCRLRHLVTGRVIPQNFFDSAPVQIVQLESRKLQYLYQSGEFYHFMEEETYNDVDVRREQLTGAERYLTPNLEVSGLYHDGSLVKIELPNTLTLKVVDTAPGVRGDTVTGGSKTAVLETGLTVRVPLFVNVGDAVKVDTRTGEYVARM